MYIYEKTFIPYFLVLGSNEQFKYKKNHKYENSMGIRNGLKMLEPKEECHQNKPHSQDTTLLRSTISTLALDCTIE